MTDDPRLTGDSPPANTEPDREAPSTQELWDEYFHLLVNEPETGHERRCEIGREVERREQEEETGYDSDGNPWPPFDERDPEWPKLERPMSPFELRHAKRNGYAEARERELKELMSRGLSLEEWRQAEEELYDLRHGRGSRDEEWGY